MKISFLSTFYPFRGGIAQFNARLFRELEKDHSIKAFNFTTQYPSLLFPGSSQYVSKSDNADAIPSDRVISSVNPLSFSRAAQLVLHENPDLLLTSFWMPWFGPSMGRVASEARRQKVRTLSVMHNATPHEPSLLDRFLLKKYLMHNQGFIALSQHVHDRLKEWVGDTPVLVLPHPVYDHFGDAVDVTKAQAELGIASGKRTLLFFGLIREYKGLDVLLRAFSKLDERYQLVIAGEAYGSFDALQQLIDQSPNRERIFVHREYIPDSRVPYFFSAADALVLPYRSGTQSGVAATAYHFDLPVIATDVGGLREMVDDRLTGVIVPSCTPDALKEGIERHFQQWNDQEGVAAIRAKRDSLSWKRFAEQLTDFAKSF